MNDSPRQPFRRRKNARAIRFEPLEARHLLAVDWRNPTDAIDINDDRQITAFDAIAVINELNLNGTHSLSSPKPSDKPFWDATGNNAITAFDALAVINHLNRYGVGIYTLTEQAGQLAVEHRVTITAGDLAAGSRTYQLKVDTQFDSSDTQSPNEDVFSVYLVDPATGQTVIDAGTPGSSLFSLAGTTATVQNGLASWNGSLLSIDLTEIAIETLELRLQLLSLDADSGSKVFATPWSNTVDLLGTPGSPGDLRPDPASPGGAVDLTQYYAIPGFTVEMENSAYNAETGRFTAEVRLVNNSAAPVSNGVMLLPGLPAGATAVNNSGNSAGTPYWNFGWMLSPGSRSDWMQVVIDFPANQPFRWQPEVLGTTGCAQLAPFGVFCGTITETEEQHVFTMPLAHGDELLILPMKVPGTTSATSPQTRMIRPFFGAEASFNFPTSLRSTFEKYEVEWTGDHQFELTGKSTGDFSVAFHKMADLDELTIGSERSGLIDPRLGPLVYEFNGIRGQTIFIENRLPVSQTRYGSWRIFSTSSDEQFSWYGASAGDAEFILNETGRYYLVFSPPDYTTTPTPYDFILRTPQETHHPTTFSATENVTFTSSGQRHIYDFNATAGQQVIFDSLHAAADPTRFTLINPVGVRVPFSAEGKAHVLTMDGAWQLIVRGDQPGSFSFKFHNLADLPVITSGTAFSGTVGQFENDYYRLPAAAGELLQLNRTTSDPVDQTITGPTAQVFGRPLLTSPYEIEATGDTLVKIHVATGDTADRNYTFMPTKTSAAPGAGAGLDVDFTGTINPGSTNLATFTAGAGTQILIDVQKPAGSSTTIQYTLTGNPSSVSVTEDSDVITLMNSGTYTIRGLNSGSSAAPYAFRIVNLANAPLLADGDNINATLSGYQTVVRRINARIDDELILEARGNTTFASNLDIRILTDFNETYGYRTNSDFRLYDLQTSGDQFLVMEQTSSTDRTLNLQAHFERSAATLPLDTPIIGTLDANSSGQVFKFSVQPGQILYLDSLALSTAGAINVLVSDHRISPEALATTRAATWYFDEPGEHYLWLSSSVATPVTFTVRASFAPATTTPLVFDTLTTGTLLAGERRVYSFTGQKDQVLFIDGLDETSPAAQLTLWRNDLLSPDSQRTTAGNGTYRLLADGNYLLVVGEMVGNYEFKVMDVANLPELPLNVPLTGSVAANEQTRLWRFPANVDQFIYVDSNASVAMPFEGTMALVDSRGGSADTTNLKTNNDLDAQFQYEGNNILVINPATLPFNYDLRVRTSERPVFGTNLGAVVIGTLQDPHDSVEYTFTASAGQHIYFFGITSASLNFYDPDGNSLSNLDGNTFLLKTSGEYRVRLSASGVQFNTPYRFQIVDVATLPLLPLNTPIAGSTTMGDWLAYRIPATLGQRFQFDYQSLTGATTSNIWKLIGPEASALFNTLFIGGDRTVTIPESGEHVLYLGFTAGIVNYAFQVNELVQPAVTVAGLDQTYADSVVLEERKNVEFTGYAGQRVLLDVLDRSSLQTTTRLFAPDGTILDSFATDDELYTLPVSGTYRLEFYANGAATPVNYSVRLIDASNLPLLEHNTPFVINFDRTYKGEVWAFEATAGNQLGFDVSLISNASFRLIEPDGKSTSVGNSTQLMQINKTGRHYLVMSGLAQATPLLAEGKIWNPDLLPAITSEDPVVITFAGREWQYYSFDLEAGQRVFFTPVTAFPASTTVLFKGPRNQSLTISLDDAVTPDVFTATREGRHTLIVSRSVSTPTAFTFQIRKAAIRLTYGEARDHDA